MDSSYPDSMESISSNLDNCIFFSKVLVEDLIEHGLKIAKEFGRKSPKIHRVDLTEAERSGLVPDSGLYDDWLRLHTPATLGH